MRKDDLNINIAADAAEICDRSDNLVRKVLRGDRNNEVVVLAVMELKDGYDELKEKAKKRIAYFKTTGSYDFEAAGL